VFSDVTSADKAFYFDFLGSLGVFNGDAGPGGPARPEALLTRAEFAAVVVRLLEAEGEAAALADRELAFADAAEIPEWARGVVAYCAGRGILRGSPGADGRVCLRPRAPVQGAEAIAMLIRALGNDEDLTGQWPGNYLVRAYEVGLIKEEPAGWRTIELLSQITRAQMALLAYNAFFVGRGYSPAAAGETDRFGLPPLAAGRTGYGQVVALDAAARRVEFADGKALELAPRVTVVGSPSFEGLLGRVVFYARGREGQVVYLRASGRAGFVEGEIAAAGGGEALEVFLTDGRVVPVPESAVIHVNGEVHDDAAFILGEGAAGAGLWAVTEDGAAAYVRVEVQDIRDALLLRWDQGDRADGGPEAGAPSGSPDTLTLELSSGEVVVVEVDPGAVMLKDGTPVGLTDLRELSVVSVATAGARGRRVVRLEVVDESRVTTVLDVVTRYTAPDEWTLLLVVPSPMAEPVTLEVDLARVDPPDGGWPVGEAVRLVLDSAGRVVHVGEPGPSPGRPALVKVERLVPLGDELLVTFDHRGQAHTFCASAPPGTAPVPPSGSSFPVGAVGRVNVSPDGRVVSFTAMSLKGEWYEVYAVGEGRLGLGRRGVWWEVPARDIVVYAADPDVEGGLGPYVDWRTLRLGDVVRADDPYSPSWLVLYRTKPGH
jgi:hypothetical protein